MGGFFVHRPVTPRSVQALIGEIGIIGKIRVIGIIGNLIGKMGICMILDMYESLTLGYPSSSIYTY